MTSNDRGRALLLHVLGELREIMPLHTWENLRCGCHTIPYYAVTILCCCREQLREYGALDLIEADDRDSNVSWGSEFAPLPEKREGEGEEEQYEEIVEGNNVSNEAYSMREVKEVVEGRGSDTAGGVQASKDGN